MLIKRVISGGQTGADIGGLKAARRARVHTGGWMPRGWLTEAGPMPEYKQYYGMQESSGGYSKRTEQNIIDSDCTIIFCRLGKQNSPGSRKTVELCKKHKKEYYCLCLEDGADCLRSSIVVTNWLYRLRKEGGLTVNIAGNRESVAPGLADQVYNIIVPALILLNKTW